MRLVCWSRHQSAEQCFIHSNCHSQFRRSASIGDLLLAFTALPICRMRLAAYRTAVEKLQGQRALVLACRVDELVSAHEYYLGPAGQGRRDCWYKWATTADALVFEKDGQPSHHNGPKRGCGRRPNQKDGTCPFRIIPIDLPEPQIDPEIG